MPTLDLTITLGAITVQVTAPGFRVTHTGTPEQIAEAITVALADAELNNPLLIQAMQDARENGGTVKAVVEVTHADIL